MGELARCRIAATPLKRVPLRAMAIVELGPPGTTHIFRSEPQAGCACASPLPIVALTRSSGES
jgi:hypothetical protein